MVSDLIPDTVPVPADHRSSDGNRRDHDDLESTVCSFRNFIPSSGEGSFAVVAGFLCGYPMGAKITADLIRNQSISVEEGTYLLSFCNNTSPIFIMNFLVWKTLDRKELLLPSLVILLGTPVVMKLPFQENLQKWQKKRWGQKYIGNAEKLYYEKEKCRKLYDGQL